MQSPATYLRPATAPKKSQHLRPKIDTFVVAILIVIGIAYIFPEWGKSDSAFPMGRISSVGISLIFFFYGLKLSPEKLKQGLGNWKLHVLVQFTTFLFVPLIVLSVHPLVHSEEGQVLWLAFLFLAALPSTVSSSVVMVSIARGNVPGAIFNASISGLIGIIVTPLWMGMFLQRQAGGFDPGPVYLKLLTGILLPVLLGLLLQRYWGKYATRHARLLTAFDKSVILLIIYQSFAESFDSGMFGSMGIADLLYIALATLLLFAAVYALTGFLSGRLGFGTEDRITARFCGTKKSLVHGTVYAGMLFPATLPLGIILLPLMLYHAFQILIVSVIASKLAGRETGPQV